MKTNIFFSIVLILSLMGCELTGNSSGGRSSSSSGSDSDYSYNGPGSNWSMDIDGSTFTLEESDSGMDDVTSGDDGLFAVLLIEK